MRINTNKRGFTLIELIVSIGLFSIIMTLAAGSYLVVIGANRSAQAISTNVNNLSFALENIARSIRTGTNYGCPVVGTDCAGGSLSFSFTNSDGQAVTYDFSSGAITERVAGASPIIITDPAVTINTSSGAPGVYPSRFYVTGTKKARSGDPNPPQVVIVISGTVQVGPGKPAQSFTIETSAVMRSTDI